jgi:hypothetical protein
MLGVLIYGIAEASTAYLITKITEPPPRPEDKEVFKENDIRWNNKHEFLNLPLDNLDILHKGVKRDSSNAVDARMAKSTGRQFT